MDDMWRQPSCSRTISSILDNLRLAFKVFKDFQGGGFGAEWDDFDSLVDICDCYRHKQRRREVMTIAIGDCGSQLTHSLEEMLLDPVVPASNKHPVQECQSVTSPEYFIDASGVRSRAPLYCTPLVSSEDALECVMKNALEPIRNSARLMRGRLGHLLFSQPVVSVFRDSLQLDPLCVKASNQYLMVLFIPGEVAEVILLPRFSYPLGSDPTQIQRVPSIRKPLRFIQWPEDVDYCGFLSRSYGTELSAREEPNAPNHRRNSRAIERAAHPLFGQMGRKITEAMAIAEPCFEDVFLQRHHSRGARASSPAYRIDDAAEGDNIEDGLKARRLGA